ncbi:hypothetical protein JXO59_09135, partial [candidate division KSB1 bacterium]|nr:hypothetical protein [candidate division KSB1 bacterium]
MKKLLIFLTVFCLFAMGGLYGQNFTLSIHNQHPIHPEGAFYFDIYMLRTGATALYLGNADLVVTFNSSNFTNPTYVIVSEGMTGWYTFAAEITSGNRAVINISQPPFGDQPQFDARVQNISNSGNGTLIAQVKITGISDPNGYAGIQWRTSTPNAIVVNALSNVSPWGSTDITGNGTFTDPPDVTLPVELSIFSAIAKNNRIVLHWITESEQNNTGFNIYRSLCPNSGFKKIN